MKISKNIIWLGVCGLMALSLVMASCAPAATTATPTAPATPVTPTTPAAPATPVKDNPQKADVSPDVPQYGGTLTLTSNDPTNWDPIRATPSFMGAIYQKTWSGDWARGPAGGYGTSETDWGAVNNDLFDLKIGFIAESTKWTINTANEQGTIVYQIRRGIHWALNPASEASRLVNGRELTADDVVYVLTRATTNTISYVYNSNIELRNTNIAKTGPWEITANVPLAALYTCLSRFGEGILFYPPEVVTKYGDMASWKVSVGSGPLMLADYVPGSVITQVRNPNYWKTDPVGPGKGNQLPYLDSVRMLIIPDNSTQQAALRTGLLDMMSGFSPEAAAQMRKTTPALKEKISTVGDGRGYSMAMRTDKAPFSDIRVRRAMMLAIDFQAINKSLFGGVTPMPTFPYMKAPPYDELYLGLDDPEFPASAKELYNYNPDKAMQILKEAGYPSGFKTELLLTASDVDYYSIIKDMLFKVGIDVKLDVRDSAAVTSIKNARTHAAMAAQSAAPIAIFTTGQPFGLTQYNLSMISDLYINDMMLKVRLAALTDQHKAMALYREMTKYVVDQAYAIPQVIGPTYSFWWPWIGNYSGETRVGYDGYAWYQWVWYNQALKKSMGY